MQAHLRIGISKGQVFFQKYTQKVEYQLKYGVRNPGLCFLVTPLWSANCHYFVARSSAHRLNGCVMAHVV